MKKIIKIILACLPSIVVFLYFSSNISAAVMSSTHYAIQSDNLTPRGAIAATSSDYIFRDTLGEVSTGTATSSSYYMRAGWQEMQETYLTISSPGDISMTPTISGITGGVASGSAAFNVITDNSAGFLMGINASTSPALVASGDITYYFSNYPATSTPSYTWSVPAGQAQFGFTTNAHTQADAPLFLNNGVVCNSAGGSYTSEKCWAGFYGTSTTTIINRTSRTDNTGESEAVKFKADSEAALLESGTYKSTITTTVSAN